MLEVPATTGPMTVTGLGGQPKAVFFYGTNWTTEDEVVVLDDAGTAVFRGMAAPQYDAPATIVQNAASLTPASDQYRSDNSAVLCVDGTGQAITFYQANLTSFDSDGFTLNWTVAPASGAEYSEINTSYASYSEVQTVGTYQDLLTATAVSYKVIYIALLGVTNCAGRIGIYDQTAIPFGFKAGASLLHATLFGPVNSHAQRSANSYGGGAYPTTNSLNWRGAGVSSYAFRFIPTPQYLCELDNANPTSKVTSSCHFSGPSLIPTNLTAGPSGTGLTSMSMTGEASAGGMMVVWDDETSSTGRVTPAAAVGGTVLVSLAFKPGLVLGYTISNEPDGSSLGYRGAVGFSIATRSFQWSTVLDGSAGGAYQSFQRGFTDCVQRPSVHGGQIELIDTGFVVRTLEATVTPSQWVWHAFGELVPEAVWIPQIYRRILAGAGVN